MVYIDFLDFVKKIADKPQLNGDFMLRHFDKDTQWKFGLDLLKQMGYDFEAGRQDISSHPFTINFNSQDVRVTTRVNENNLHEMIWSCVHEGGHALYEQGLDINDYGLPSAEAISLGIHESQSRLWENNVGRSLGYWKHNFPLIQSYFPNELKDVSVNDFYKAMNLVEPSLIRTSADELTYHFHILIRFEIEKALIEGSIEVADLPTQWNKKYKEYLGIEGHPLESWQFWILSYLFLGKFLCSSIFQASKKRNTNIGKRNRKRKSEAPTRLASP